MEEQNQEGQEQPAEESPVEEAVEQVKEELDRPEENYKAELARKNARIRELEDKLITNASSERKRDPQDITTWSDQELKMLKNSPDPNLVQYKDQADDILLERKVKQLQAKEYESRRKEEAHQKLVDQYPEAADPTSKFSQDVEKVMREYDLSRTPAGRLVAAKIVAAESKTSVVKGQKKESDRVARVKSQMTEGDRPRPVDVPHDLDKKRKELADKLMDSKKEESQIDAVSQILKDRGMTQAEFFKNR